MQRFEEYAERQKAKNTLYHKKPSLQGKSDGTLPHAATLYYIVKGDLSTSLLKAEMPRQDSGAQVTFLEHGLPRRRNACQKTAAGFESRKIIPK
jgi:hypothetical protein